MSYGKFSLSEGEWLEAVDLWESGCDTKDIAHFLDVHKSLIYNGLPWRRKEFPCPTSPIPPP